MEMANKHGQMKLSISDSIRPAKNTVKANLCGLTIVLIMEISFKITFTAMANINGKMEESMKVSGKITKCKEKAPSHGQMEENTLVIILKTENKALASLLSKMVGFTKDNG